MILLYILRTCKSISEKDQYTRVKAVGEFDHSKEMLVGPRTRNDIDPQGSSILSQKPDIGYYVFTPFCLTENGNKRIIVNRGWISKDASLSPDRIQKDIQGIIEVDGIIRMGESPGMFQIENNPEKKEWYTIDLQGMCQYSGSDQVLIELYGNSSINQSHLQKSSPSPRLPKINFRNSHLEYAITW